MGQELEARVYFDCNLSPLPLFLLLRELKLYGGVIFITTLPLFHLETANTQKSEVFLLRNSSGNVNTSGFVTCRDPQIY